MTHTTFGQEIGKARRIAREMSMTERLYPFQMPCSVCRVETWAEGWTGWTVSYRMRMQESSAWEYDVHSVGLCDDNGVNRVAKRVEEVLRRKYAPYQIEVLSMRVSSLQTRDWEVDMRCECEDPGCPEHKGQERCTKAAATKVSRCDYSPDGKPESWRFCEGCAQDAVNSGAFS